MRGLKSLFLGSFEVDEIENQMAPATVQIKAVGVTFESSLRGEKEETGLWGKRLRSENAAKILLREMG